ncbi:hypothetical protein LCGC14_1714800 [marine sediment metagenome]|uniref:Uncharacterized protein n=1 Tax=marine sediment metagenome TaxID=412755 RepID=A0A0F9HDW9_9ZZZZ
MEQQSSAGQTPEYELVPKRSCRRCLGRGYINRTVLTSTWIHKTDVCSCVKKIPIEKGE